MSPHKSSTNGKGTNNQITSYTFAGLAQWTEHNATDVGGGGSNPSFGAGNLVSENSEILASTPYLRKGVDTRCPHLAR